MSDKNTVEGRVTTLEKQVESLSIVLHQFVKTLQDMRSNSSEVSQHMAAILRTIYDSRSLTKAALVESSVLNQIDKLNHYLQSAIQSGIIEPTNEPINENSLIVGQQFDSTHEEVNRRVLLNSADMSAADKQIFAGKSVGDEVTGFSEAPTAFILIHEVYAPVKKIEKPL